MTLRAIDLFAGIGGFHQASHNLGVDVVFASEWEPNARKTYQENFQSVSPELFSSDNFVGDVTQVIPSEIPDFDILMGGFPCQPFSHSGKRQGFQDEKGRGNLFFNIISILKEKQPEAFFLENVRGLLNHDNGNTFQTIQSLIHELGYTFHWRLVKASDFNVPQHRPRVFMVGFRSDIQDTFQFPEPVVLTNTISHVLGGEVTTYTGKPREVGFTLRVGGRRSGIHDRRNWDGYIVDGQEHFLTVNEGKKMQGFPESFVFPVSDVQAFKQLGNSVAVPAVQATLQALTQQLDESN
jgi:DNA (cytosine-5)-methyltransferase 1